MPARFPILFELKLICVSLVRKHTILGILREGNSMKHINSMKHPEREFSLSLRIWFHNSAILEYKSSTDGSFILAIDHLFI